MGHEHKCLFIFEEEILKPEDRADIEMVGGLIEKQEVRFMHQGTGQKNTAFQACREYPEPGIPIQFSPREHRFHSLVVVPGTACFYPVLDLFELSHKALIATAGNLKLNGKFVVFVEQIHMFLTAGSNNVIDRSRQIVGDVLGEHGNFYITASNKLSFVRGNITNKQLHKGRFAGTVSTQQTDSFACLDLERNPVQQERTSPKVIETSLIHINPISSRGS